MFHMLNGPRPFPAADREQKLGRGMMENKNKKRKTGIWWVGTVTESHLGSEAFSVVLILPAISSSSGKQERVQTPASHPRGALCCPLAEG